MYNRYNRYNDSNKYNKYNSNNFINLKYILGVALGYVAVSATIVLLFWLGLVKEQERLEVQQAFDTCMMTETYNVCKYLILNE